MEFFGWTRSHLNNFIKGLKVAHMITYRTTHRYTVITVINYEVYQSNDKKDDPQNDPQVSGQKTYRRPTDDHKQECIKNDLRMKKKLSDKKIKENKKNITRSKNHFLKIVNGDGEEGKK